MFIVHKTNSTWSEVNRNLSILEELEFIEIRRHRNMRLIKFNEKKREAIISILKMARILENVTKTTVEEPIHQPFINPRKTY